MEINFRRQALFHLIVSFVTVLLCNANAADQAKQPTETQLNCTRGTNPYQDLKDSLNLVTDDFRRAGLAVKQQKSGEQRKIAKRISSRWKKILMAADGKHKIVPNGLTKDVELQSMVLEEPFKGSKPVTVEDLQKTHNAINFFAETLTCPEPTVR